MCDTTHVSKVRRARKAAQTPERNRPVKHHFRDFCRRALMPISPTSAYPGTEAKVEVMAARVRRGEVLFHPEDAVLPDHVGFAPVFDRMGRRDRREGARGQLVGVG